MILRYINPAHFATALAIAADLAEARTTRVGTSQEHTQARAEAQTLRTIAKLVLDTETETALVRDLGTE